MEHWTNAVEQGAAAAENLLAGPEGARPFAPVPFFWSDQYDTKIQYVGSSRADDEVRVVHGSVRENRIRGDLRPQRAHHGGADVQLAPLAAGLSPPHRRARLLGRCAGPVRRRLADGRFRRRGCRARVPRPRADRSRPSSVSSESISPSRLRCRPQVRRRTSARSPWFRLAAGHGRRSKQATAAAALGAAPRFRSPAGRWRSPCAARSGRPAGNIRPETTKKKMLIPSSSAPPATSQAISVPTAARKGSRKEALLYQPAWWECALTESGSAAMAAASLGRRPPRGVGVARPGPGLLRRRDRAAGRPPH